MTKSLRTFLMFTGRCEEAVTFCTSLITDSKVVELVRWGAGGPGREGSVMRELHSERHKLPRNRQPGETCIRLHAIHVAVSRVRERGGARPVIRGSGGGRPAAHAARQIWFQQKIRLVQRPLRRVLATEPGVNLALTLGAIKRLAAGLHDAFDGSTATVRARFALAVIDGKPVLKLAQRAIDTLVIAQRRSAGLDRVPQHRLDCRDQ